MSAPGQDGSSKKPDTTDETGPAPKAAVQRDIIPVWLIVGIFAVVLIVTAWLLHENWMNDMTRYRSSRAQHNRDFPEAVKQLKKLIEVGEESGDELVAKSPTYWSEMGHSYKEMKDYKNALDAYQKAQAYRTNMGTDDQGNPRAMPDFQNMIGYLQLQLGNVDAATSSLQAALQVDKLDPVANFTLGEIAMMKGNYIEAADYFKVVADNPAYDEKVKSYYAEIEQKLFAGI